MSNDLVTKCFDSKFAVPAGMKALLASLAAEGVTVTYGGFEVEGATTRQRPILTIRRGDLGDDGLEALAGALEDVARGAGADWRVRYVRGTPAYYSDRRLPEISVSGPPA